MPDARDVTMLSEWVDRTAAADGLDLQLDVAVGTAILTSRLARRARSTKPLQPLPAREQEARQRRQRLRKLARRTTRSHRP